jgi:tripartite-type tricarboxylate transporter receptor subunit TctC
MLALRSLTLLVALIVPVSGAWPQAYPSKPIRFVAPFPAGGSSDLIARVLGQRLADALGQPVVIDNRPGASGSLGTALVAKSAPDGYTLALASIASHAINGALYKNIGYDPVRDFATVSGIANAPQALVIYPGVPAKNVGELLALARAKPDTLTCGSGGVGTPAHLGCEMLRVLAGIRIIHVPYKGTGQSVNDLLGGQIHMVLASMPVAFAHVRTGKLRALAVSTAARTPLAPDLPTLSEAGVPGYVSESWWGLTVPTGTPAPVIERLRKETERAVADPQIRERFAALGIDPWYKSPAEFREVMRTEIARTLKLVRDAGIKPE